MESLDEQKAGKRKMKFDPSELEVLVEVVNKQKTSENLLYGRVFLTKLMLLVKP